MLWACCLPATYAQESKRTSGSVQISFLPPPLEKATYSLGVFDAKTGKLVRQLQTAALEKDFTVGLNGLITTWDGKDDAGKTVPAGHYAARGYAMGSLKVEGEDIFGNDWAAADENLRFKRILALAIVPEDDGLIVVAADASNTAAVIRLDGAGKMVWRQSDLDYKKLGGRTNVAPWAAKVMEDVLRVTVEGDERTYQVTDGKELSSQHHLVVGDRPDLTPSMALGKDHTRWMIESDGSLVQSSAQDDKLRQLISVPGGPLPQVVVASTKADRLYLLETKPGWQRVRGLSWVETKEENGHPVSTWQTFFERNIRMPDNDADADYPAALSPVDINLDENPLTPGKAASIKLTAIFDAKGSYLATENGLRLRQVSERPNLEKVSLAKGKPPSPLEFFQYDGAATDVFSIKGLHNMMAFDAGEFELTANGEKPVVPRPTEPPDL